jgi:MFS family permease
VECVSSANSTLISRFKLNANFARYFNSPKGNLLGIITASLFLPAIVCSFLGDWLCTRFGRKKTIYVGSLLIIIGGTWNGMSQALSHFIACKQRSHLSNKANTNIVARVIVGIGGGITKVAAPALLHELAHPRLRATMGTLYYGFYHLGGLVSGIMCSEYSKSLTSPWRDA